MGEAHHNSTPDTSNGPSRRHLEFQVAGKQALYYAERHQALRQLVFPPDESQVFVDLPALQNVYWELREQRRRGFVEAGGVEVGKRRSREDDRQRWRNLTRGFLERMEGEIERVGLVVPEREDVEAAGGRHEVDREVPESTVMEVATDDFKQAGSTAVPRDGGSETKTSMDPLPQLKAPEQEDTAAVLQSQASGPWASRQISPRELLFRQRKRLRRKLGRRTLPVVRMLGLKGTTFAAETPEQAATAPILEAEMPAHEDAMSEATQSLPHGQALKRDRVVTTRRVRKLRQKYDASQSIMGRVRRTVSGLPPTDREAEALPSTPQVHLLRPVNEGASRPDEDEVSSSTSRVNPLRPANEEASPAMQSAPQEIPVRRTVAFRGSEAKAKATPTGTADALWEEMRSEQGDEGEGKGDERRERLGEGEREALLGGVREIVGRVRTPKG